MVTGSCSAAFCSLLETAHLLTVVMNFSSLRVLCFLRGHLRNIQGRFGSVIYGKTVWRRNGSIERIENTDPLTEYLQLQVTVYDPWPRMWSDRCGLFRNIFTLNNRDFIFSISAICMNRDSIIKLRQWNHSKSFVVKPALVAFAQEKMGYLRCVLSRDFLISVLILVWNEKEQQAQIIHSQTWLSASCGLWKRKKQQFPLFC